MSKTRCQVRGWNLVFSSCPPEMAERVFNTLSLKKWGFYSGFSVSHFEKEEWHTHIGLILRDTPKDFYMSNISEYFKIPYLAKSQVSPLTNKSKNFSKKLQTYYDYCIDQEKHPDQKISEPYFHKSRWTPETKTQKEQKLPLNFISELIFDNLTIEQLDDQIYTGDWEKKTRIFALQNYDKLCKMINTFEDIKIRKERRAKYKACVATYRGFQIGLTNILDTQNDRNIHLHADPGITGKNLWLKNEGTREDTLILQNSETKRIAFAWNPKKHRRIIFDIPKGKMQYLNTAVIEALKNGQIFSSFKDPKSKSSSFNPTIVICGNESLDALWTEDRLTESTTNREDYKFYGDESFN